MFVINHKEAEGNGGFKIATPGDYEVTVTNYEMKEAASGNQMIVVDYEIRSDVSQEFQGQKVRFDNFVVSENAMWKLHAISKAARFPDGISFGSYKEWADTLKGSTLVITIAHREYNGNKQLQVKGYKESKYDAPSAISNAAQPFDSSDLPF